MKSRKRAFKGMTRFARDDLSAVAGRSGRQREQRGDLFIGGRNGVHWGLFELVHRKLGKGIIFVPKFDFVSHKFELHPILVEIDDTDLPTFVKRVGQRRARPFEAISVFSHKTIISKFDNLQHAQATFAVTSPYWHNWFILFQSPSLLQ